MPFSKAFLIGLTKISLKSYFSVKLIFRTYFNGSLQKRFDFLTPYFISEREVSEPMIAFVSSCFIKSSNTSKKLDSSSKR